MNQQFTFVSHVPVNMDRVPLTNQDPNTHLVAGAPPNRKPPPAGTAVPSAVPVPAAQTNHRNGASSRRNVRVGKMTLRHVHESTTSIHDRLSGWQGPPPSIEEREDEMRREAERLEGIVKGW